MLSMRGRTPDQRWRADLFSLAGQVRECAKTLQLVGTYLASKV